MCDYSVNIQETDMFNIDNYNNYFPVESWQALFDHYRFSYECLQYLATLIYRLLHLGLTRSQEKKM